MNVLRIVVDIVSIAFYIGAIIFIVKEMKK